MVETAFVDRVSRALGVSRDELVKRGVEEFLKVQLRACFAEVHELEARYGIKGSEGLEGKIREGVVDEHPAWEDLIVLENLEGRARKIQGELDALRS